jgi:thiamine biosynthesis lipoprotein
MLKRNLLFSALIIALIVGGLIRRNHQRVRSEFYGACMGTSYSVKISDQLTLQDSEQLKKEIENCLTHIDDVMSTWKSDSEISYFNTSTSDYFKASASFFEVTQAALSWSHLSDGVYDPTVKPLLDLWGFGLSGERKIPSNAAVEHIRKGIGSQQIRVHQSTSTIEKLIPTITLDLSGLAKGYSVDQVGRLLRERDLNNWFIEIGGEVRVLGLNFQGDPWRIGIEKPNCTLFSSILHGIVSPKQGSIATSGNYRNYLNTNDVYYSHIINPKTGHALKGDLFGVSVYAIDCMSADAVATALNVMGVHEGLTWVEQLDDIDAHFIVQIKDDEYRDYFSSGYIERVNYRPYSEGNK